MYVCVSACMYMCVYMYAIYLECQGQILLNVKYIFVLITSLFLYLTRFNRTRLSSKAEAQIANGQGSHWLIKSPTLLIYV